VCKINETQDNVITYIDNDSFSFNQRQLFIITLLMSYNHNLTTYIGFLSMRFYEIEFVNGLEMF